MKNSIILFLLSVACLKISASDDCKNAIHRSFEPVIERAKNLADQAERMHNNLQLRTDIFSTKLQEFEDCLQENRVLAIENGKQLESALAASSQKFCEKIDESNQRLKAQIHDVEKEFSTALQQSTDRLCSRLDEQKEKVRWPIMLSLNLIVFVAAQISTKE